MGSFFKPQKKQFGVGNRVVKLVVKEKEINDPEGISNKVFFVTLFKQISLKTNVENTLKH